MCLPVQARESLLHWRNWVWASSFGRSRPAHPRPPGVTHPEPLGGFSSTSRVWFRNPRFTPAQSRILQPLPFPSATAVSPLSFFSLWGFSPLKNAVAFPLAAIQEGQTETCLHSAWHFQMQSRWTNYKTKNFPVSLCVNAWELTEFLFKRLNRTRKCICRCDFSLFDLLSKHELEPDFKFSCTFLSLLH